MPVTKIVLKDRTPALVPTKQVHAIAATLTVLGGLSHYEIETALRTVAAFFGYDTTKKGA